MTDREREGWIVVGAIFVTMFFIWGAINSGSVFFVPVLKYFGWSRAKLSIVFSIGWVTGGAAAPVIGWLADRVSARQLMIAGAAATGVGWCVLSRADGFPAFLALNGIFGVSVGLATGIPSTLMITSWFHQRRGLALGIAFSGSTLGGAAMTMVSSYAIAFRGWRFGYALLGTPILLLSVPLLIWLARGNPESTIAAGKRSAMASNSTVAVELPGLEIRKALVNRSFWLISLALLLGGLSVGMAPHYVAYLIGLGYSAAFAAGVVSLYLIVTTAGTLLGGPLADRLGARSAMSVSYLLAALGMLGMLLARFIPALGLNIVAGGFAGGALSVQMPLITIESLGLKRLGSLLGITSVFFTLGAATGPIIAGRIFDVTTSYTIAISTFLVILLMCSAAILGCQPLAPAEKKTSELRSVAVGEE